MYSRPLRLVENATYAMMGKPFVGNNRQYRQLTGRSNKANLEDRVKKVRKQARRSRLLLIRLFFLMTGAVPLRAQIIINEIPF